MNMLSTKTFKDKNIIITGASSGIGASLAQELSLSGCANLILIARRKDKLEALVGKIAKDNVRFYICDVARKEEVDAVFKIIRADIGMIDVAFLNAGIGDSSVAQNINGARISALFNTNFFGVVYWMEHLLQDMQKRNEGTIVVTSSLAAYRGLGGSGPYCASKAALSTLIESYQVDLLATNIRLVLVTPYFVATQMSADLQGSNPWVWMTAQKAAQKIIGGLAKGKMHIVFPWHFHLFIYLLRIMPLSWYRLFWKVAKRGG